MKKIILLFLLSLNIACAKSKEKVVKTIKNDKQLKIINDSLQKNALDVEEKSTLTNVSTQDAHFQDSIDIIILAASKTKNIKELDAKLTTMKADSKMTVSQKSYWTTYILYNQSVIYKVVLKDDDKASKAIDLALETIEKNPQTSEDFALLGACKSFSIQFANMTQLAKISGEVSENANKALQLNPKNRRAYYVIASNNFYTPKMFGGMTKVEEYALKALACPNSLDNDYYSPYWGKDDLYNIYIQYLESENRKEDAQKYSAMAKKEFPNQF